MVVLGMSRHRLTAFRADAVLSTRDHVLECSSSHAHLPSSSSSFLTPTSCTLPPLHPPVLTVVSTIVTWDPLCPVMTVLDPVLATGPKFPHLPSLSSLLHESTMSHGDWTVKGRRAFLQWFLLTNPAHLPSDFLTFLNNSHRMSVANCIFVCESYHLRSCLTQTSRN